MALSINMMSGRLRLAGASIAARLVCIGLSMHCAAGLASSGVMASDGRHDALAALGRQLFSDKRLSADGATSCASCHQPDKAFQDGLPVAIGVFGQLGTRNTPSLLRVSEQRFLFWDGRRSGLAQQALDPLFNAREHGLESASQLEERLDELTDYAPLLAAVAQAGFNMKDKSLLVGTALAAYERTLGDGESPFEKYRYRGDEQAISSIARRGWTLFAGRGQCIGCHQVGPQPPALFTDNDFHYLAQSNMSMRKGWSELTARLASMKNTGAALGDILLSDSEVSELGRFAVTGDPQDIGKFKTPSLRNVALTAPYMHDGSVATLAAAVDLEIYYRGTKDGHPLIFTEEEKRELVAFMQSLTALDPSRAVADEQQHCR